MNINNIFFTFSSPRTIHMIRTARLPRSTERTDLTTPQRPRPRQDHDPWAANLDIKTQRVRVQAADRTGPCLKTLDTVPANPADPYTPTHRRRMA